jgi:hypothetical protein
MSVLDAGPMTPDKLKAGSSSTAFGGGEIDNISLFPLPAAPGSAPVADWSWVSLWQGYFSDIGELLPSSPSVIPVSDPHFYNYQLETFLGQHGPTNRTITAPMYVRIAMRDDYYLISYFGFFAYNGGAGSADVLRLTAAGFGLRIRRSHRGLDSSHRQGEDQSGQGVVALCRL